MEAAAECSLPLVPGKEVTESSRLLAENKNTRLAGKAGFLHLPVFVNQQGVIRRLGAAVFPAPFGFGNNLFALLNGGLIAVNLKPVFARFQLGFAELGDLRNTDGLGEGFRKRWHCQGDGGQQGDTAEKRIGFHACQVPFGQDRVSRTAGCHRPDRVDTHAADE